MMLANRGHRPSLLSYSQKQVVMNVIGNKVIKDDQILKHTI